MIVEIFSIHAAVAGEESGTTWRGELSLSPANPEDALEIVYRFLNRVDEGDHERMAEVGYTLPSLSMGDFVTLHLPDYPRTWRVASVGFEPVTGNADYLFRQ
jgi:hypothetical protein